MKLTKRQIQTTGFLGLVLAAIALAFAWPMLFDDGNQPSGDTALTNVLVSPQSGSAKATLPAQVLKEVSSYQRIVVHTGVVESRKRTMVAFQRGGTIKNLLADEGERVSPKTVLAILDDRQLLGEQASLQANLNQANAVLAELRKGPRIESIEAAKNVVVDLKQQLKAQELRTSRSRDLLRSKSIAKQDYERELYAKRGLEARLKASESQLAELETGTRAEQLLAQEATVQGIEAQLQILQYNLDDCQLEAPFQGMIIARFTDPGSVVAAGTPAFELIDDRNLEIHVGIPPKVAESLEIGQRFDLVVGKHKLQGILRTVLPMIDPATRTCKAIIDVELSDPSDELSNPTLFTGQLAKVQLIEQIDQAGFWIPMDALAADHSGLWSCLVVDPDQMQELQGIAKKHSVEILFQRDQEAFVRGTLKPGGLLIGSGVHRIVAGQEIRVEITGTNAHGDQQLKQERAATGMTSEESRSRVLVERISGRKK